MALTEKNIHNGHRSRMRLKCLEYGPQSFEDHELVEMLLYYCVPMKDTNPLAHKMMNEYKTLSMLIEADPNDLMRRCGIGDNMAVFFAIAGEIMKRANSERWTDKTVIGSSDMAGEFAVSLLSYEKYECFYVISLDSQNRLINSTLISKGTVDEAHVYPRLVVETALRHNASNVILAHNHPGGSTKPSMSDISTTIKITQALNAIDILVADHIIVAEDRFLSMADKKLLSNKK